MMSMLMLIISVIIVFFRKSKQNFRDFYTGYNSYLLEVMFI